MDFLDWPSKHKYQVAIGSVYLVFSVIESSLLEGRCCSAPLQAIADFALGAIIAYEQKNELCFWLILANIAAIVYSKESKLCRGLLLGFLIWQLPQCFSESLTQNQGALQLLLLLSGLLISRVMVSILELEESPQRALGVVLVLIALGGTLTDFKPIELYTYESNSRYSGAWSNPNIYGQFAGCAVIILSIYALQTPFTDRHRVVRFIVTALIVLFLFTLLSTYSRGALIALFGVLAVSYLASPHWWRTRRPAVLGLVICGVLALHEFSTTQKSVSSTVSQRLMSSFDPTELSSTKRIESYKGALLMILDRPVVGYGWSCYGEEYDGWYKALDVNDSRALHLNNYLAIGLASGLFPLLLLAAYLVVKLQRFRTVGTGGFMAVLLLFWIVTIALNGGLFRFSTAITFWCVAYFCQAPDEPTGSVNP